MQTIEQSCSKPKRGWAIASLLAIGAAAAAWQFAETREPGYFVAAAGFLLSLPRVWFNPIEWRDPMDMVPRAIQRPNIWTSLHRIGFALILGGLIWATWM